MPGYLVRTVLKSTVRKGVFTFLRQLGDQPCVEGAGDLSDKTNAQPCRESVALVTSPPGAFTQEFYARVFSRAPDLRALFPEDMFTQGRKLYELLNLAMGMLGNPADLVAPLNALGRGHATKGVLAEHFPIIAKALIDTLGTHLGGQWSAEYFQAWQDTLDFVMQIMIEGALEDAT